MHSGAQILADRRTGQETFFALFEKAEGSETGPALPDLPPWRETELLKHEKEAFGFFFTSHPLTSYREILDAFSQKTVPGLASLGDNEDVLIGGMITHPTTKAIAKGRNKGKLMARFVLEDLEGKVDCVLFSDHFKSCNPFVEADRIVFVHGRYAVKEDKPAIFVDRIIPVERAREELSRSVILRLGGVGISESTLTALRNVFSKHRGECQVYLEFSNQNPGTAVVAVGKDFRVAPTDRFHLSLTELLGRGQVTYAP